MPPCFSSFQFCLSAYLSLLYLSLSLAVLCVVCPCHPSNAWAILFIQIKSALRGDKTTLLTFFMVSVTKFFGKVKNFYWVKGKTKAWGGGDVQRPPYMHYRVNDILFACRPTTSSMRFVEALATTWKSWVYCHYLPPWSLAVRAATTESSNTRFGSNINSRPSSSIKYSFFRYKQKYMN